MSAEFARDGVIRTLAVNAPVASGFDEGVVIALAGNKCGEICGQCRYGSFAGTTDIGEGLKYPDNQDSISKVDTVDRRTALSVVDGMGGYGGASIVSQLACNGIAQDVASGSSLSDAVYNVSLTVRNHYNAIQDQVTRNNLSHMAGVVVAVEILENQVSFVHMGDSRGILIRGGEVVHRTHDHNTIQNDDDRDAISQEQASTDPRCGTVTRFIGLQGGMASDEDPEVTPLEIKMGDLIILASDGLWKNFSSRQVAEMIGAETDSKAILSLLREAVRVEVKRRVAEALAADPKYDHTWIFDDNVSIIVYRHGTFTNGETPSVDEHALPKLPQE